MTENWKKKFKNFQKYHLQSTSRRNGHEPLTTTTKENDLETIVDTFTEAMQIECMKSFKIINKKNEIKQKNQSPCGQTILLLCGNG